MNPALFSSQTDEWATPPDFFAKMARRYGPFDLDVCAQPDNSKCPHYFTPEVDGLAQPCAAAVGVIRLMGRPSASG